MRRVGRIAAQTLVGVGEMIGIGVSTGDINYFVHEHTLRQGGRPAPLHYGGFPKSVCTSRNHVVCHGVPDESELLEDGDIINVDITSIVDDYHGDTSATFYIGNPGPDAKHIVEVARQSLEVGIAQVRNGAWLGDIGAAVEEFVKTQGCSIVRRFDGHGIGRLFHEPPWIHHYGEYGTGLRLQSGMTFTIEPAVNLGAEPVDVLDDNWTYITRDGSLSAQFEHTVLVTDSGCEVLTHRSTRLAHSALDFRL